MIRTFVFSASCLIAAGALALAQDADPSDFSNVDAALEALTRSADDTQDEAPPPAADGETVETLGDEAVPEGEEAEEEEVTPLIENSWIQSGEAVLRGLDKITGRSTDFTVAVGEPKVFGALEIDLSTCFARPPEQAPENAAFLTVSSVTPMEVEAGLEDQGPLFSGWMFASSPGLNALEHSVYDVWVISCGGAAE